MFPQPKRAEARLKVRDRVRDRPAYDSLSDLVLAVRAGWWLPLAVYGILAFALPAVAHRGADRRRLGQGLDHILDRVDRQRVRGATGDGGPLRGAHALLDQREPGEPVEQRVQRDLALLPGQRGTQAEVDAFADAEIRACPMADGGEGTLDADVAAGQLDIPSDIHFVGKQDPGIRKATAIVNGDVLYAAAKPASISSTTKARRPRVG